MKLYDFQLHAIRQMKNGCILCGDVGSGKSITALGYYYLQNGGSIDFLQGGEYEPMDDVAIRDLYIITTARKRDTLEWEQELARYLLSTNKEAKLSDFDKWKAAYTATDTNDVQNDLWQCSSSDVWCIKGFGNLYRNRVVVDSWNNIKKYAKVAGAFFIFDEQRVVGSGTWVKSFLSIARKNKWILLSATPGDTWQDYIPVFVANGFYRNKTEFLREHAIYNRFSKYPKIDGYRNTGRLCRLRNDILVPMDFALDVNKHHQDIYAEYNNAALKDLFRLRKNPWTMEPLMNAGELYYCARKIVNSDPSRQVKLLELFEEHPKMIIFYNFDYELDILRSLGFGDAVVAEWNGHRHDNLPTGDSWVYFVQYAAGAEGWNCITTDTIVFFSQHYSYKVSHQAEGRISRMNTPYKDLYYYHLKSKSWIDLRIARAYEQKKEFNANRDYRRYFGEF